MMYFEITQNDQTTEEENLVKYEYDLILMFNSKTPHLHLINNKNIYTYGKI